MTNKDTVTFHHTPDKLPAKCGIGWLLESKIKDKAIEGITQNLLDFYSMKYRKIPQVSSYSIEELCDKAIKNGFEKILIMKQGIVLNNFIEDTKPYWENEYKDCVIVGHVLDREEAWWQIHPQTLYIDLKWWAAAGCPAFGEREDGVEWDAPVVGRSDETLGEGQYYNPVNVWATDDTDKYMGKWQGWNLLKVALEHKQKIGTWSVKLRQQKEYVYGEMMDYPEKAHQLGNHIWNPRWYAANTETISRAIAPYKTAVVYTTGGGISPIANAYLNNLIPGGELVITDAEPLALHMQHHIFNNWDCNTSYKNFIIKYGKDNPIIEQHYSSEFGLDYSQEWIDYFGDDFKYWWENVMPTFRIEYRRVDLLNIDAFKKWFDADLRDKPNDTKIFIDVSNAFNYEINASVYSKNVRLHVEQKYIDFFLEHQEHFIAKGFDIGICNRDERWSWMQKLFPWQKV